MKPIHDLTWFTVRIMARRLLRLEAERIKLRAALAAEIRETEPKSDRALVEALKEARETRLRLERALSAKDEALHAAIESRDRALADTEALSKALDEAREALRLRERAS